jgi:flagellar basal body P-ring protein FlgI
VSAINAEGDAAILQQGTATAGRLPGGAIIEREIPATFKQTDGLVYQLRNPDFTTAVGMADVINAYLRSALWNGRSPKPAIPPPSRCASRPAPILPA